MNQERAKRKLCAVLSADVQGYSRLMGEDDVGTIKTLKEYRRIIAKLVEQYRGRVVDAPGDNVLAEFVSVVDATECAVTIQAELKNRNAALPENRRMKFRIGINHGDVVEDGASIYGDGINIAARIEKFAKSEGICISRTTYNQVKNKLNLGYEYLGEHSVKNIAEPVRVYRILTDPEAAGKVFGEKRLSSWKWQRLAFLLAGIVVIGAVSFSIWSFYFPNPTRVEAASLENMAFPLPTKPSLAVYPFDNLSDDAEQEYIADGISDNITTILSKIPEIFVISRNSTFTYKGKAVKVKDVAEQLGVQYVLMGTVQKSGDRLRVSAQLIDALTGYHLWAERYDRGLKDFFELVDQISHEIVISLQVKLIHGEQFYQWAKGTDNLEAWSYLFKGLHLVAFITKEATAKARKLFEQALNLDSDYAYAWAMLAFTYHLDEYNGWAENPTESMEQAFELIHKSLKLDDSSPDAHAILSKILFRKNKIEEAIVRAEKAIALGPNNAVVHVLIGDMMYYLGKPKESISLLEKAMRLHPYYPDFYLWLLGKSYHLAAQYEDSLKSFKQLFDRSQKNEVWLTRAYFGLILNYLELGRVNEARVHATEAYHIDPHFSFVESAKRFLISDNIDHYKRLFKLLQP
ncbi:MAG: adenylate/guanylate cyclase domain-containing protein [Planctomycetota bacterium]|jgi:TolB-like protein/class 3 adenylate cyclase/Tfp pilus assembly protein PilF